MLAGATSGDLYFPADTSDDVANATLLGLVPELGRSPETEQRVVHIGRAV